MTLTDLFFQMKHGYILDNKTDANGAEHGTNGQFVSKGGNSGERKEEPKKTNDEYRKEIKEKLAKSLNKDLQNKASGTTAKLSIKGLNKMTSGVAIKKSIDNGFTPQEHFEAVKNIVKLFENAELIKSHKDLKHGVESLKINRYVAQDKFKDGTKYDALITAKETIENGQRLYSLELDEINHASKRFETTDKSIKKGFPAVTGQKDETRTRQGTPATGSRNNTITHDSSEINSLEDLFRMLKTQNR
jgi:hypothetical protein